MRALAVGILLFASHASAQPARDVERLALDAARGYAPQPPRPADLFRRARRVEAESFEGMLVCEVRVVGETWDGSDPRGPVRLAMGRVELGAELQLPGRDDRVRVRGPDDANRVTFAVAGVRLGAGDTLGVALEDRDVVEADAIDRYDLVYAGELPLVGETERSRIECRGVPESALSARIAAARDAADEALEDLNAVAGPSPDVVGFRGPDADPNRAWLAIYRLASWVGLADPRFLERRDRLRASEAAYLARVAELIRSLRETATPIGTEGTLPAGARLVVTEYDCKLDEILELHGAVGVRMNFECVVHVVVRAERTSRATVVAHVVDALGGFFEVETAAVPRDGTYERRPFRLDAGETIYALPIATRAGVLLRVAVGSERAYFRLEPPRGYGQPEPGAVPSRIDLRSRP